MPRSTAFLLSAICVVPVLALAAPASAQTGGPDKFNGGVGDDNYSGQGGDDTINGNGGADTLNGDAGDDSINGGAANDTIDGGTGHDNLDGGLGDDGMTGGDGNDNMRGGDGNDTMAGEGNDDNMNGGDGDDNINGGPGDDKIRGGTGNDKLNGGLGNDKIRGGPGLDVYNVEANDGNDRIILVAGDVPNGQTENCFCGPGKDTVSLVDIPPGNVAVDPNGGWNVSDPDTGGTYHIAADCEVLKSKGELLVLATLPCDPGTTTLVAWGDPFKGLVSQSLTDVNGDGSVGAGVENLLSVIIVATLRQRGGNQSFDVINALTPPELYDLPTLVPVNPAHRIAIVVFGNQFMGGQPCPLVNGQGVAVNNGLINNLPAYTIKNAIGLPPDMNSVQLLTQPGFVSNLPNYTGTVTAFVARRNTFDNMIGAFDCDGDDLADEEEVANGAEDVDGNSVPDACECPADLDGSGDAGIADLLALLANWGTGGSGDINTDASVDIVDLLLLLANWGACPDSGGIEDSGACCFDSICADGWPQVECVAQGGVFQGPGTDCAGGCPP